uniref:Uncharacterized protein n=1 Tax=Timema cristinae TaxID=61476 RepID=A0A7R9D0T0_TIMCR|nr:unnamed protein product [Timema cristinae]
MARLLNKWIMEPNTEIVVMSMIGICYTMMEDSFPSMRGRLQYLWTYNFPQDKFYLPSVLVIKTFTVLSMVMLARKMTTPVYIASYYGVIIVAYHRKKPFPPGNVLVFLSAEEETFLLDLSLFLCLQKKKPFLLTPWIWLSLVKNLIVNPVSLMVGTFVCLPYRFPLACLEFFCIKNCRGRNPFLQDVLVSLSAEEETFPPGSVLVSLSAEEETFPTGYILVSLSAEEETFPPGYILKKKPFLLTPWIWLSLVKNLIVNPVSLMVGTFVCLPYRFPLACLEFFCIKNLGDR